jgi:hypothetical protein
LREANTGKLVAIDVGPSEITKHGPLHPLCSMLVRSRGKYEEPGRSHVVTRTITRPLYGRAIAAAIEKNGNGNDEATATEH